MVASLAIMPFLDEYWFLLHFTRVGNYSFAGQGYYYDTQLDDIDNLTLSIELHGESHVYGDIHFKI